MVRRFALWLQAIDPRTEVPPVRLLSGRRGRRSPHIYSIEEVRQLMTEASRLQSRRGLRAHTYTTIIGLLATTGLRPGEILALGQPDVNLESGILFIRESKHGKSRFVPVHHSTREALAEYAERRDKLGIPIRATAFFVAESGQPIGPHALRRTFAKLSMAIGLRAPAATRRIGRGPEPDLSSYRVWRAVLPDGQLAAWPNPARASATQTGPSSAVIRTQGLCLSQPKLRRNL